MRNKAVFATMLLGLILLPYLAYSMPVVLDLEGLQGFEEIQEFYNGGTGSLGSAGTNFGVSFSANSLALKESDPLVNIANSPSPETTAFFPFLPGSAYTANVAAGFDTGFSFFYSSTIFFGSVTVYDGFNGLGNTLATLSLPALGVCAGRDSFCNWAPAGVKFNGIAKSVDFSDSAEKIGFDNITFGSEIAGNTGSGGGTGPNPVPEPSIVFLLGTGLAGLAAWRMRKAKA